MELRTWNLELMDGNWNLWLELRTYEWKLELRT
jgi:hypothetical protein